MSWRRVTAVSVIVVTLAGGAAVANAAGTGIGAAVKAPQAGDGAVSLSVSTTDQDATFAVSFQGRIVDHGWTYSGTLTGTGVTWAWSASLDNLPILTMTSANGLVAGTCGGTSGTADAVTSAAVPMQFRCVLSRGGGTPWEVTLDSVLVQQGSGGYFPGTWSGDYVVAQASAPQVDVGSSPTYGEVQLGDATSPDGYVQYGPLRLSGQIDIGGRLYRGDLVSGTSAFVQSNDIPALDVAGSSHGDRVSGTCSGTPDPTDQAATSYDLTCSLAMGSAAPVTVTLKTVFTSGMGACSYRDCWGDDAGRFTAG